MPTVHYQLPTTISRCYNCFKTRQAGLKAGAPRGFKTSSTSDGHPVAWVSKPAHPDYSHLVNPKSSSPLAGSPR